MKITPSEFVDYMRLAFNSGYEGRNKEELIQEIVAKLGPAEDEESESDFRIYSLDELRAAPEGSTFISAPIGPFKIESYGGSKFCRFMSKNALITVASLNCSSFPLNKGIRKVSSAEFQETLQNSDLG